MKAMACYRLSNQGQLRIGVTKQFALPRQAAQKFRLKARRIHPQRRTARSNRSPKYRIGSSKCKRHSKHPLMANEANVHWLLALILSQ
jgi:hypothetical protein